MNEKIVGRVTKTAKRKSLYHFTRVENLESIAYSNTLYASNVIYPNPDGKQRVVKQEGEIQGHKAILNAHLRIADSMMDSDTTVQAFRAFLDAHVFLWPTLSMCQKMVETYLKREPHEKFAVFQFDAYPLLVDNFHKARLSKYDSGSMPRYPKRCSYKKTLRMFLPLSQFQAVHEKPLVPRIPSEIYEILIDQKITHLHQYMQAIYCNYAMDVPVNWRHHYHPLNELASV